MKKCFVRLLSMLMVVCMLFALAACGNSGTSAAAETETASGEIAQTGEMQEEVSQEVPQEAPSATVEEPILDASAAEVVTEAEDSGHLYPVFDEVTNIEAYLNIAPWASAYIGPEGEFENAYAILKAEEYTNVHLDVTWSDPDTYNEKMNLLIAADDLPHITRNLDGLYNTGADGLIEDGLCVDLYEYFEEYAPDYYALLEASPKFKADTTATSGVTTTMYSYTEIPQYTRGPIIRKDMLDAIGMEIPATVAELYDVAVALKNYGVKAAVVSPKFIADAYYGADFISSNSVAMTWWNVDGVMTAAVTMDSNYEWALEARKWDEEGLFTESWYTPMPWYDNDVLNDQLAIAFGPYSLTSDATAATAANPDTFEAWPMANVVLNEGDTIKTQDNSYGGRGDGDWCITCCDESIIPQIVSYVNWFFTEEGRRISNYGEEGVSYELDGDGNVQYTELITKDTGNYGSMAVYAIFTNNNDNPFYFEIERVTLGFDNEIEATVYDTWLSNMTSEYVATYSMTADETAAYNAIATDVVTTVQEYMTKFMTGDMELNEASWADFQQKLVDLGIEDMQEIVQGAFDRSNA